MHNQNFQNKIKLLLTISISLLVNSLNAQLQLGADIDGEGLNDRSGTSVSMPDSYTIAIGAPDNYGIAGPGGHARIYRWNGVGWTQKGVDLDGEAYGDSFGVCVSMPDSNTVAVGGYTNDGNGSNSGHVRIFRWNGTAWSQKGLDIDGEAISDGSGRSISMPDSNTIAIGAPNNGGTASNAGHVRIFRWNGTSWSQKGLDIDGEATNDQSGTSVSMPDANTVAIGAPYNGVGHVRIYNWNGTAWLQKGLDLDGEGNSDQYGRAVSMPDANTIAIGGGSGSNSGYVRIFNWNGTTWSQKGMDINGEAYGDGSGSSVDMPSPNTVAIGAPGNNGNLIVDVGHVRIYDWSGTAWTQRGSDIDGEAANDYSGRSVSMPNDSTVAIGATNNDGTASNAGHVRIYYACSADSIHEVVACGSYTWNGVTYTSSNNTATDTVTTQAGCERIIHLNLTINNANSGVDVITACDIYTWIDGNTYTSSNNTATHTLTNAAGCDSTVTLNLTINSVSDLTTSTSEATISSNNNSASYQWLDCNDNNSVITGETGQSYVAVANGNYAVELTENGCVDTSACITIANLSIVENSFGDLFKVHPNPTNGNFSIDLGDLYEKSEVLITDLVGKLIDSKTMTQSKTLTLSIEEPAGIYIVSIQAGDKKAFIRLVKE